MGRRRTTILHTTRNESQRVVVSAPGEFTTFSHEPQRAEPVVADTVSGSVVSSRIVTVGRTTDWFPHQMDHRQAGTDRGGMPATTGSHRVCLSVSTFLSFVISSLLKRQNYFDAWTNNKKMVMQ